MSDQFVQVDFINNVVVVVVVIIWDCEQIISPGLLINC
jgi:hypothetical protein